MSHVPAFTSVVDQFLRRLRRAFSGTLGIGPGARVDDTVRADPSTPAVDLLDCGDEFVVLADLPGFDTDDLSVSVTADQLTIEGDCTGGTRREGDYLKQERQASTMRRRITLPEPVDPDAVTTGYRRGVVQVVVKKATDAPRLN